MTFFILFYYCFWGYLYFLSIILYRIARFGREILNFFKKLFLATGRFAAACLFSGWTVRCRIRKKIIRTPFLIQGSYYSLMAARGKPQLNTWFSEILIYTLYILTSRFLSNLKPKNAHSMGKKTSLFHTKIFLTIIF